MVQHDLGFRESAGEVDQIAELAVEHPRLEGQVERRQCCEAFAPGAVEIEPFAGARGEDPEARVGVPGGAVADAAEATARGDDVLFEDAFGAAADAEIDIADDPGAGPCRAVFAALAHRRHTGDKRRLAKRAQFGRPFGAVHLAAFEEHRGADVVAAAQILDQIVQQIAVARPVPQMMVRIDDRAIGFERGFLGGGEPVLADRQMAAGRGCLHRVPRESFASKSATVRQRMPRF